MLVGKAMLLNKSVLKPPAVGHDIGLLDLHGCAEAEMTYRRSPLQKVHGTWQLSNLWGNTSLWHEQPEGNVVDAAVGGVTISLQYNWCACDDCGRNLLANSVFRARLGILRAKTGETASSSLPLLRLLPRPGVLAWSSSSFMAI